MVAKTPIRATLNGSEVTGLAEYQSGEFIDLSHGGLGASLSIGTTGQVLKVNSGGTALEFGNVEAVINIDTANDLTGSTLVSSDQILLSDGGTEGRVTLSQLDTLFSGTTQTLTNKTLTTPTIDQINTSGSGLTLNDAVTVTGNLTVNGTTTTINSTTVDVVNSFRFEGATADGFETNLTVVDPTADRTITLPNATGTVALTSDLTSYITASTTDTLTNKTFDANGTGNTISNIEVADFATGVVDTDLSSVSASDDTLASAKAIKSYVDSQVTAQDLDFQADTGGALNIDLDSETLTFTGGTGIDTSGSGNTVTFAIDSTVTTNSGTQTLTNKTLTSPTISGPTITGDATFDTNTLHVDSTNNRIGIGTTSPAVGLDFQMINSEEGFRVRRHNSSGQYIDISETDGSRHEIKGIGTKEFRMVNDTTDSGQGWHFYRNGSERFRILGDGLITLPSGAATLVGDTTTQTLTNKTIDASSNTISNIGNSQLISGIDAAKISSGSVSNTEFDYLDGVTSGIQTQLDDKASKGFAIAMAIAL